MRNLDIVIALFLLAVAAACGGREAKEEADKSSRESSSGGNSLSGSADVWVGTDLGVAQALPGQALAGQVLPGITVTGSGEATGKPDGVLIRLTIGRGDIGAFDPSAAGLELIDEEELDPVVAALKDAGVSEDDITVDAFATSPYGFGTAAAQITLLWDKPGEIKSILETIQDAVRRETDYDLQNVETLFTAEDCETLEATAREAALEDAARQAEDLAEAAGLSLGDIVAVAEAASPGFPYAVASGCEALRDLPSPDSFQTVQGNSPSKVTVSVSLQVTYAID